MNAPAVKTRVVVVDDSALVRAMLAGIIDAEPDLACVGVAADAYAAREMIRALDPDVVTLDVEMPGMDGLEFLSRLMRLRPTPVVMVSSLTERGAETTLRALGLGAVDFVAKPRLGVADGLRILAEDITAKVRAAAGSRPRRPSAGGGGSGAAEPACGVGSPALALGPAGAAFAAGQVVVIGASTGGTEATREVLEALPADAPPVLVAQHMPAGFTKSYAIRLDRSCRMHVKEAEDGDPVVAGQVYVAAGGHHLWLERGGGGWVARVGGGEPVNRHKPSVEVLFRSAAAVAGGGAVGVMLTGMGGDGAAAMRGMRDAGAWNVAQDEASCVVFGMPKEAIAAGAVHRVLPLAEIGPHLVRHLRAASRATTAEEAR